MRHGRQGVPGSGPFQARTRAYPAAGGELTTYRERIGVSGAAYCVLRTERIAYCVLRIGNPCPFVNEGGACAGPIVHCVTPPSSPPPPQCNSTRWWGWAGAVAHANARTGAGRWAKGRQSKQSPAHTW
jgi:hypothetical protein